MLVSLSVSKELLVLLLGRIQICADFCVGENNMLHSSCSNQLACEWMTIAMSQHSDSLEIIRCVG